MDKLRRFYLLFDENNNVNYNLNGEFDPSGKALSKKIITESIELWLFLDYLSS